MTKISVTLLFLMTTSPLALAEVQATADSLAVPLTSLIAAKPAQADEGMLMGPVNNIKNQSFPLLGGKAMAIVDVEERGEPLARPTHVSIDTHCVRTDGRWQRASVKHYDVCAFRGLSFDKERSRLKLKVRTSALVYGIVKCVEDRVIHIPVKCTK